MLQNLFKNYKNKFINWKSRETQISFDLISLSRFTKKYVFT